MHKWSLYHYIILTATVVSSLICALVLFWDLQEKSVAFVFSPSKGDANIVSASLKKDLVLPIKIAGTDLIAEKLIMYDGPYVEDGSNGEVFGIYALVVYNPKQVWIENANIQIRTQSALLEFSGSYFPPGKRCVLLECNQTKYENKNILSCDGTCAFMGDESVLEVLTLTNINMGQVNVKNESGKEMKGLVLYYKTHDTNADIYIGGITHKEKINNLGVNESLICSLGNYAKGYSQIIYAEINTPLSN